MLTCRIFIGENPWGHTSGREEKEAILDKGINPVVLQTQ